MAVGETHKRRSGEDQCSSISLCVTAFFCMVTVTMVTVSVNALACHHVCICINYSRLNCGGLCLNSTVTLHSVATVQFWLQRPTHPGHLPLGVLTRHPCSSNLAE